MLQKNTPKTQLSLSGMILLSTLFLAPVYASQGITSNVSESSISIGTEDESTNIQEARLYLNHTKVSVAKVRKTETANKLTASETLTIAEKLIAHAEELFTNGNIEDAIKCSSKARQIAFQNMEAYTNKETAIKSTSFIEEHTPFIEETLQADKTSLEFWIEQLK